jgi:hypothetical protein
MKLRRLNQEFPPRTITISTRAGWIAGASGDAPYRILHDIEIVTAGLAMFLIGERNQ